MSPLIAAAELARRGLPPDLVIVDCRHDLLDPDAGVRAYQQGHLPGALHMHLDRHLCGTKTGCNGRHPLPAPDTLAQTLGELGIGGDCHVIAYDAGDAAFAARLWWLLRWLGHDAVQVLDGGWAAWQAAGLPAEQHVVCRAARCFQPQPNPNGIADVDDVLVNLADRVSCVVDARAPSRFSGQQESIDPVAGHIPGALNRFYRDNLDKRGCFKSAGQLRHEWLTLLGDFPATQTIHQCGSGVTACQNLLALEVAGMAGGRLYPGSWSEWCADASRPVALGGV